MIGSESQSGSGVAGSADSSEPSHSLPTEEFKKTRGATILLVEDNELVAGAVTETLGTKGWSVETLFGWNISS